MQHFDRLNSICASAFFINCSLETSSNVSRLVVGFAFFDAGLGDRVFIKDESEVPAKILEVGIPEDYRYKPTTVTLSSPEDNIEFPCLIKS